MKTTSRLTLLCLMLISVTTAGLSFGEHTGSSTIEGLEFTWRVGGANECHFDCKSTNCHHEETICRISPHCPVGNFAPGLVQEASCQTAIKNYTCNLKTMDVKGAICRRTGATNTEDCGTLPHTHPHAHTPPISHEPPLGAGDEHTHEHEHQSKHCSITLVWPRSHANAHTFEDKKVPDEGSDWCNDPKAPADAAHLLYDPIGGANYVPCN